MSKWRNAGPPSEEGSPSKTPLQQASVVPYRGREDGFEICLITSMRTKRWVLPKGLIAPGDSAIDTAFKEALEEAGLQGRIVGDVLSRYAYRKWSRDIEVTVYLMEVERVMERWAESHLRDRRWVEIDDALSLLEKPFLRDVIRDASKRIAGEREP